MANEYTLSNTAANIDSAITRVVGADTEPTAGSQNMVTSGGVKAAIDSLNTNTSTDVANIQTDLANIQTDLATKTKAAVFTSQGPQTFATNPSGFNYGYETVSLESKVDADFAPLSNNQITLSSGDYLVTFGFAHRVVNTSSTGRYIAWRFKDVNSGTGDNATPFYDQIFFTNTFGGLDPILPVVSSSSRNVWNFNDRNTISSKYLSLGSNLTFEIIMATSRTNAQVQMKDLHLVFVKL